MAMLELEIAKSSAIQLEYSRGCGPRCCICIYCIVSDI